MVKSTAATLTNAIAKAQSRKGHAHVRHVGDDMFEVACENAKCSIQAVTLRDAMIVARVNAARAAARNHRVVAPQSPTADAAILMRTENGKRKEFVRGIQI